MKTDWDEWVFLGLLAALTALSLYLLGLGVGLFGGITS